MQRRPSATRTELTVLVPPEQIAAEPGLEARTREAIARYAQAWATAARQTQDIDAIRARRVLGVAALFFAVANFVYLWYGRTGSVLGISGIVARRRRRGPLGSLVGRDLVAPRPVVHANWQSAGRALLPHVAGPSPAGPARSRPDILGTDLNRFSAPEHGVLALPEKPVAHSSRSSGILAAARPSSCDFTMSLL